METMKPNFTVKKESIVSFLVENLVDPAKFESRSCDGKLSPHDALKSEMFFKKNKNIGFFGAGDKIKFELKDQTRGSGRDLMIIYLYEVVNYDDVSIKLVLLDFSIIKDEQAL